MHCAASNKQALVETAIATATASAPLPAPAVVSIASATASAAALTTAQEVSSGLLELDRLRLNPLRQPLTLHQFSATCIES